VLLFLNYTEEITLANVRNFFKEILPYPHIISGPNVKRR